MPDFLVIEVTNGRALHEGGQIVTGVADETEAVAVVVGPTYNYAQEFRVFNVADSVSISTEQSRSVSLIDAQDQVLGTYDEAALEQLRVSRSE